MGGPVATLVIITHEFDRFFVRRVESGPMVSPYLLFDLIEPMQAMAHTVRIVRGPKAPGGDAALYHVDSTIAPSPINIRGPSTSAPATYPSGRSAASSFPRAMDGTGR